MRHALENDRRGLGRTYVAIAEEADQVIGYVTLCSNSVHFENVPTEKMPHYPIPAILIARLAVAKLAPAPPSSTSGSTFSVDSTFSVGSSGFGFCVLSYLFFGLISTSPFTDLMLMALRLSVEIADRIGVFVVTVDAMSEDAKAFYQKRFGFTELLDDPQHLFVTVADLRASGIRS